MEELSDGLFRKETVRLKDGRYLIYYDFISEDKASEEADTAPVRRRSAEGKDE